MHLFFLCFHVNDSIEEANEWQPSWSCDFDVSLLSEPEAVQLAWHIGHYDLAVRKAAAELQPKAVAQYLLQLGWVRGYFSKNHRKCSPPGQGVSRRQKPVWWLHNWMISDWMFWISCIRGACSVSSFCDFQKITFCNFTAFFSFLIHINLSFSRCSYEGVLAILRSKYD